VQVDEDTFASTATNEVTSNRTCPASGAALGLPGRPTAGHNDGRRNGGAGKRATQPVTHIARKSNRPKQRNADLKLMDAPRASMPRNIAPMLATQWEKAFDHPDWIFEIKWDGYRAIAEVEEKTVH